MDLGSVVQYALYIFGTFYLGYFIFVGILAIPFF